MTYVFAFSGVSKYFRRTQNVFNVFRYFILLDCPNFLDFSKRNISKFSKLPDFFNISNGDNFKELTGSLLRY